MESKQHTKETQKSQKELHRSKLAETHNIRKTKRKMRTIYNLIFFLNIQFILSRSPNSISRKFKNHNKMSTDILISHKFREPNTRLWIQELNDVTSRSAKKEGGNA
jgi:uncharacterized membrane protein